MSTRDRPLTPCSHKSVVIKKNSVTYEHSYKHTKIVQCQLCWKILKRRTVYGQTYDCPECYLDQDAELKSDDKEMHHADLEPDHQAGGDDQ